MPELPEVETVTKVLKPLVENKKIIKIDILRKETIIGDPLLFKSALESETFLSISRIGKYIIFHLTNDKVIISHLRMEGKYYHYQENEKNSYYSRVVFHLSDKTKLCYDDSRCFGIMIYSTESEYKKEKEIAKLGPEPFDITDSSYLMNQCKNKRLPIKTTLLDQSLMTGLGNIYADETLFVSKIHPLTSAKDIKKEEWDKILLNSQKILKTAIELGGSTIKSYHPGKDMDGKFQINLKAYGKSGQKCPNCGSTFRFIKVNGRGTTFCPNCQKKHGAPINIGLTGKIASGKSTILDAFKKAGYDVISSDKVVAEIYGRKDVAEKIEKLLQIKFESGYVEKDKLRTLVALDPSKRKKLEHLIHPMVEKEIEQFLTKSKSPIRICEVPLLFESGLDTYFDTIVISTISKEKQIELLTNRNKEKALLLNQINSNNRIDANLGKATYIISNDSFKEELEIKIKDLINKLKCSLD